MLTMNNTFQLLYEAVELRSKVRQVKYLVPAGTLTCLRLFLQ